MKRDIIFLVVLFACGVLACDVFVTSMDKAYERQLKPVNQEIQDLQDTVNDIQAKLNYKTGDVAAQLYRMDQSIDALKNTITDDQKKK